LKFFKKKRKPEGNLRKSGLLKETKPYAQRLEPASQKAHLLRKWCITKDTSLLGMRGCGLRKLFPSACFRNEPS